MSITKKLAESGDFVSLPRDDEYQLYFKQMSHVFEALEKWCVRQAAGGNKESQVLRVFLKRLLRTIELLRERQRFRPDKNLKLDLNESGFPHFLGLEELNTDFRNAESRLAYLPGMLELKERALDTIFKSQDEPRDELSLMAERRYLEQLKDADFLGPFRFAGVVPQGKKGKRRHYFCAWSCYNSRDNLPYIHTMMFEQDARVDPLEDGGEEYEEFKKVIASEGSRTPPLAVLAATLDDHFETIHPKILKRTKIGPIALPRFTFDQGPLALMVKGLAKPDEFSIEMQTEMLVSSKEVVKEKGSWLRPDKVRDVFSIPVTDLECFDAKVTRIHKYLMLPHHLMQHMQDSDPEAAELYKKHEKIVFDNSREVYEI